MSRIRQIRKVLVSRIIAAEEWWDDCPTGLESYGFPLQGRLAQHLVHQAHRKRRRIVEQIVDLSTSRTEKNRTESTF